LDLPVRAVGGTHGRSCGIYLMQGIWRVLDALSSTGIMWSSMEAVKPSSTKGVGCSPGPTGTYGARDVCGKCQGTIIII
jgi:hypothetical protein